MSIENINKLDGTEKLLQKLETMTLDERIKDQKDFLINYYKSESFEQTLKNEIQIYNEWLILDKDISNTKKLLQEYISSFNIKMIKAPNSKIHGLTIIKDKNDIKTRWPNFKWKEDDEMVIKVAKMIMNNEINKFDIIINSSIYSQRYITTAVHEMYHSLDFRIINPEKDQYIHNYIKEITKWNKDRNLENISSLYNQNSLDYIFQYREIKANIIELKYILFKLWLWNMNEDISNDMINEASKIIQNSNFNKIRDTYSTIITRLRLVSWFKAWYVKDLEKYIDEEERAKILLKILMNSISQNKINNTNTNNYW